MSCLDVVFLVLLLPHAVRWVCVAAAAVAVNRRATHEIAFDPPEVLVQIPTYKPNASVVAASLDAVLALDYDQTRITIQVLDDSPSSHIDSVVLSSMPRFAKVAFVRRGNRVGFKSGAQVHGQMLERHQPFVLMLDEDFQPEQSMLRFLVLRALADDRIGCVQGKWTFRNKTTLFERAQCAFLSVRHLEDAFRVALGVSTNFHGTVGLWRRAALNAIGGCMSSTILEDMDLTIRAHAAAQMIVFEERARASSVNPIVARHYLAQQDRWERGRAQVGALSLRAIFRAKMPVTQKVEDVFLVAGGVEDVFVLAAIFASPVACAVWLVGTIVVFCAAGEARLAGFILRLLLLPVRALATIKGLLGLGTPEFIVTPKS